MSRTATVTRKTRETNITVTLDLDGSGKADLHTGIGFFDHMLDGFARHGLFDLTLHCDGDLNVDCHHTIEDCGIALGTAIREALGDKAGIVRYGSCMLPMDETLALCAVDKRITPCIDFGHLNARTLGGIQSKADYAAILDRLETALGDERARRFHVHFSRIEFSKGGEKRHWTFAETQFGPEPQPLMELLAERGLAPVLICESAGTQAEDARAMQAMYRTACKT